MSDNTNDLTQEALNLALRKLLKNGHISSGVNEKGEIVFWCTKENEAKFNKERHLYKT